MVGQSLFGTTPRAQGESALSWLWGLPKCHRSYRPTCVADAAPGDGCKSPANVSLAGKKCVHLFLTDGCFSQHGSFISNEDTDVFHFFTQKLRSTPTIPTSPAASPMQPVIKISMYPTVTDGHI